MNISLCSLAPVGGEGKGEGAFHPYTPSSTPPHPDPLPRCAVARGNVS